MKALPGVLSGTIVFENSQRHDEQGFVTTIFDSEVVRAAGLDVHSLVHERQSRTGLGGVRGLHLRTDGGEGQLVRCAHGAVLDVAVDLRPSSPSFRLWMTVVLDDVDHRSVWLPAGLAHGYQALTEAADVCCRADRLYRSEFEATIRHDDPDLAIPWPLPVTTVSGTAERAPALAVVEPMFNDWFGALR